MYKITAKSDSAYCLQEKNHTCKSFEEALETAFTYANHKNKLARNGYLYKVTVEDVNTKEIISVKSGTKMEEIYF